MGVLSIILFFLGAVFLFLGWRWQSSPNDEAKTALKGLAYLRREIIRVQDQLNLLVNEVQNTNVEKKDLKEAEFIELRELKGTELKQDELKGSIYEPTQLNDRKAITKINILNKDDEPPRFISSKYQQVLELAARGQGVPEIAQNLLLSQDAVQMVLKTQHKGVIQ
ncbi:MAG: DNA-binding response regulator [Bacillota bacterium]|nr:DNA-binding response regulator [Bacillota bacterium]